ncbi:(2Fe-2S)-binding protein [Kitasatospora sp. NBC_01539]|uniref:(2Fe-2S)-binding protein n=1 Tax=Kitasatospora sp. NBC_01539 TaxID=2903577 RepID=UPI003860331D
MSGQPDHLPDRVGRIGPYFAVRTGAPGGAPPDGFRPLRELYATGPGSPIARKSAAAARQLGTAEPRVAASIVHLGLAARLWSVALGTAALGGAVPDLDPDRAHFALPPQGPLDLWLPHAFRLPRPAVTGPGDPLVEQLHRTVVVANLASLAAAVRSVAPVAPRLLDGNAASALAGTVRVLGNDPELRRTGAARTAAALARALLDSPPLLGTGTHTGPDPTAFRRNSCCLYYRVPGGGVCGDCVFDRPPRR